MFCRNCGNQLNPGDLFCASCGTKNVTPPPTSTVPPTAVPPTAVPPTPVPPPVYAAAPAAGMTVVNVKRSHKGLIIGLISAVLVVALAFLAYLFFFTNFFKSDDELIRARIDTFVTDYNNGDFEALMESFDDKTRSTIESTIGLTQSMFGGMTGFDVNYSDLFGLGVAANGGDMMKIQDIQSIEIQGDKAVVTATMILSANMGGQSNSITETAHFELVKEETGFLNHDWFISNMY